MTFTSPLCGYSLIHPADWLVEPATESWSGDWAADRSSADVLTELDSSVARKTFFSVKAATVPAGTTAAVWAEANVPRRPELASLEDGRPICKFGSSTYGSWSSDEWRDASIGGEPARVRAACGFVDAVVVVENRAYLFSMFTKRSGGANTDPFDAIARTVEFTAD